MQIDSIILGMDYVLVGITGEQDKFIVDISHIYIFLILLDLDSTSLHRNVLL